TSRRVDDTTVVAADWTDVPALIESAAAPIDKELRACAPKRALPWAIVLIASRDPKTGKTTVQMPFPPVGIRGLTPEEKCPLAAVPKIELPDLPAGFDRIDALHMVLADGATPAAPDKAFDTWRDPA